MTFPRLKQYRAVALAVAFCVASPAYGADAFQSLVDASYAPYRTALFKSNSNDRAGTIEALDSAAASWAKVLANFRTSPPPAYASDGQFQASLDAVRGLFERARAQASAGSLAEAHETMENVRDTLGTMRQRNGVIVFSDHVNAYHTEMERIIGNEITIDDRYRLIEQTAVLNYLDGQMRANAPASVGSDPKYRQLAEANSLAVANLRKALLSGDRAAIAGAIDNLKPAYAKLFLSFG